MATLLKVVPCHPEHSERSPACMRDASNSRGIPRYARNDSSTVVGEKNERRDPGRRREKELSACARAAHHHSAHDERATGGERPAVGDDSPAAGRRYPPAEGNQV